MGGYGSGRTGGNPISELCRQIDIGWLAKAGKLREGMAISGQLHWLYCDRLLGSILYTCDLTDPQNALLILRFACGRQAEPVCQVIPLRSTVPHYGGRRWWMVCPLGNSHVTKLYLPPTGTRFASRAALRLGYRSQRIGRADKPGERLSGIERKLSWERSFHGLPARPKGMWRRTFERHLAEYVSLKRQADDYLIARAKRMAPSQFGLRDRAFVYQART